MILLTFLGANSYTETTYIWGEKRRRTAFSAAACADFLQCSEVFTFLTDQARQVNLEAFRKEMAAAGIPVRDFSIPVGKDDSELWQIFSVLNTSVAEGDEIALEVTNGMRSAPILSLMAAMFMKTGRGVNVRHLLYGAFDVARAEGLSETPIFDLSPMLTLLDWAIAAERFNTSGDSRKMAELLLAYSKQISLENLSRETSENSRSFAFRDVADSFTKVTSALFVLRPYEAMQAVAQMSEKIDAVSGVMDQSPEVQPLSSLLDRIRNTYSPIADPAPENPVSLIQTVEKERNLIHWYQQRGLLMQAVTLSGEWLVSFVMVHAGRTDLLDRNRRDGDTTKVNALVKQWRGEKWNKEQRKKYPNAVEKEVFDPASEEDLAPDITREFIEQIVGCDTFFGLWDSLKALRNDIAHAAKNPHPSSALRVENQAGKLLAALDGLKLPSEEGENPA